MIMVSFKLEELAKEIEKVGHFLQYQSDAGREPGGQNHRNLVKKSKYRRH